VPEHRAYNNDLTIRSYEISCDGQALAAASAVSLGNRLKIVLDMVFLNNISDLSVAIDLLNGHGELVAHISNEDDAFYLPNVKLGQEFKVEIVTERILLIPGMYMMNLWIGVRHTDTLYEIKNFFEFLVEQSDFTKRNRPLPVFSKIFLPTSWALVS
jgi:lipopolysaccharide transport system ATP-binding protein